MHLIPPAPSAVSLFNRAGFVRSFPCVADARRVLGLAWIRKNVGPHFCAFSHVNSFSYPTAHPVRYYDECEYVMRDNEGAVLTEVDFYAHKPAGLSLFQRCYAQWNGEGPVPGTAKPRGGRSNYRRLGTTPERRTAQNLPCEGEPAPRPSRSANGLPNSYDDIMRSRQGNGWKKNRTQQWKGTS